MIKWRLDVKILCTILIPTKDRPKLLKRAIASALKAAPENAEILVVDDKSELPAQNVVAEFSDPRLKIVMNNGPSGAAAARNAGMQAARGETVFFLDDDDEILPDYCDTILNTVLPTRPHIAYGFSAFQVAKPPPRMTQKLLQPETTNCPTGPSATPRHFAENYVGLAWGSG